MNIQSAIISFQSNIHVFQNLTSAYPEDFIKWKPSPDKWCLLEVINHLYDEERDDFRDRLKHILEGNTEWAPIHPSAWVIERKYIEKDFQESLNNFIYERKQSIDWLNTIDDSDLDKTVSHPKFGDFNARQMLVSWLAHDILHIRQILRLQYLYLESTIKPLTIDYAGGW
ncbi:MAG: DinB family protein [Ignavibacteriae bacterium]|nr:MAG: DinB family protein [Ignavibacteriota bacterium]